MEDITQTQASATDGTPANQRLLRALSQLLRNCAEQESPAAVLSDLTEALEMLQYLLPPGTVEREAALVAHRALGQALLVNCGELVPASASERLVKALDLLRGRPSKRSDIGGQRLVALRCIHEWFQGQQFTEDGRSPYLAAQLSSTIYDRLRDVYPDTYPDVGNPEPWTFGVDAADVLIPLWNQSGKWSAVNALLACWELGVNEPVAPRGSEERHPLDQWWRDHR